MTRDQLNSNANNANILFIGGLHRSGTSILHRIIRSHPEISGFDNTGVPEDEGQHLQSIIPTAKRFGGPGEFCFHADAYMNETHPLCSSETATAVFKEWLKHWNPDKQILIEKSPPNLIRARFLQALFPNAKFLFILRHPVAVAYATRKYVGHRRKLKIHQLIHHTICGYQIVSDDLPHIRQSMTIRYEDFIRNPEKILDSIYNFIGRRPTRTRIENIRKGVNDGYLKVWKQEQSLIRSKILRKRRYRQLEASCKSLGYNLFGNKFDNQLLSLNHLRLKDSKREPQ